MNRKKKVDENEIVWSRVIVVFVIVIIIGVMVYWFYQKTRELNYQEEFELDQGEINLDLTNLDLEERLLVEDDGLIEFTEEEVKCYVPPPNSCEGEDECRGFYDASCVTKIRKGTEWCNLIENEEARNICKKIKLDTSNTSIDTLEQEFIQDSLDIDASKIGENLLEE
jgi:cell division protein FtsL|tara:strand:+ start:1729 stop:2232 length:504 start_codon:yes stop_codon:yes gene_type:complete